MTTTTAAAAEGRAKMPPRVLQPEDGASYWQPVPANGYAVVKVTPEVWDGPFSMGFQVVAPQGHVRSHQHDRNREVVMVWQGRGKAVIEGVEHAMVPGTIIVLPPDTEHSFINDGNEELRLVWIIAPHGLETFFAAIGRPRREGEKAPAPFPRPADVREIEARTVFKPAG